MKKKRIVGVVAVLLLLAVFSCTAFAATPVSKNGKLSVKGTKIVNAKGQAFQIKGVSTHGLSWFPQFVSKEAFKELRDKWGANTVRLAMYTAEYNGYCTGSSQNKKDLENLIDKGVKAATDLGMYVIIDWHILNDNDPNTHQKEALAFFKKMAKKYKGHNNVLYEICNEPNGGTSWDRIKTYANKTIKAIRAYDKDAIIIVGTPTWSQDVDLAAKSPLKGSNLVYTLHFYANTHRESYRAKAEQAIQAGLPILVSEFSICDASGNGGINISEGNAWISFLNKHKIGYAAWSLCNKAETSALIKSSCTKTSGWNFSDLSEIGQWYVRTLGGSLAKQSPGKATKPDTSTNTNTNTNTDTYTNTTEKTVKATTKNTKATCARTNSWSDGQNTFEQYQLTVKNKSKKSISGWKVRIKFKYAVQRNNDWCGTFTYNGKTVTVKPDASNGTIAAKQSAGIGFIVSAAQANQIVSVKIVK